MLRIEDLPWRRWGPPVEAGLEFMMQGEEWMYDPEEIKKVIDWCRENLTDPHFSWMASDDVRIVFEDDYGYGERLCIETKSKTDAMAFKLRWL